MQYILSFCILLLGKITLPLDVKVLELTAEFFENYTVRPEGVTLVMFYAPWCPHCNEVKTEFFKAAKSMANLNTKNIFALLNCEDTKNTDICQQQNIDGYPTIKAFSPQNKVHNFNGAPNEEGLLQFIQNPEKYSGSPQSSETEDDTTPDIPLNHTAYLNVENFTSTLEKMKHALVFFYAPWCPHCQDSKPNIDKASEKLKSKHHAIYAVNCEDKNSKSLCAQHAVEGYPTIKYFHNGEVYSEFEDELTPDGILKYLSQPPKEKMKETPKKKEEDDEKEDEKDEKSNWVKDLTKETFHKTIKDSTYHTMVMFYEPDCKDCDAAKATYESAAKSISESHPNHVLAAVNCEEKNNEKLCEEEGIKKYPTFVHYFEGKKKLYNETPLNVDKLVKYFSVSKKDEL